MDEPIPESPELEESTEDPKQSQETPSGPEIHVTLHVEGDVKGTLTGVKYTQIIQPRPFRPPLQRPPRAEHFTGREKELAQLRQDLQPGRVVTLCGPGGIGKTALATEAIWKLAPR
jgi:flagellar biosynthesis GTPase FlhF